MSLSYLISKSTLFIWTTPTATVFSTFSPSGLFFTWHDWSIKSIDMLIWESVLKCQDLVLEGSIFYYWSSCHDCQKPPWIPGHTKIDDCHDSVMQVAAPHLNFLSDFYPQKFQLAEVQASPQSDCIVPNCQQPGTTRLLGQVETHAGSWRRLPFKLTIKETIAQAHEKKSIVLRPGGEFLSSLLLRMQSASSPLPSANQDSVPPPINHLPKQS